MSHSGRFLGSIVMLLFIWASPLARAQTNYEHYTFTTFAGPQEWTGWYDGANSAAGFSTMRGAAVDNWGNIYVADTYNHTIRKITPTGMVTTLAGLAGKVDSTDGTGSAARFSFPSGLTVDTSGNVYVADTANHTIRKITPAGVVTTFAGKPGVPGISDGTGSSARFFYPDAVAVDIAGNVYVVDWGSDTIRKITPAKVVTTYAGLAGNRGSVNGTGTAARFASPNGIAVDLRTNVYVADTGNHLIRKITPARVVTTLAGSVGNAGTNDAVGTAAQFYNPFGVTVDTNGTLYVADTYNHILRQITTNGVVTTVAGSPGSDGSTNGSAGIARFSYPTSVAADHMGNVYVADFSNRLIRKLNSIAEVTTLAGGLKFAGFGIADGTGSDARFNQPSGVALDGNTNVYVADYANSTIRKISTGGEVTTMAGNPGVMGTNNGTGTNALFTAPTAVAVDTNGTIYIADGSNHNIRKSTPGGDVSDFAGLAKSNGTNDGVGAAARFWFPYGVAIGTNSTVFVPDFGTHIIRKITAEGEVSTFAGSPLLAGTNDGVGAEARFNRPAGIAADKLGNVYVADGQNHTIRKIASDGAVTTIAGKAGSAGFADGAGIAAQFSFPFGERVGMAVDSAGNLFVTDNNNALIRKITPAGLVTTLAGKPGESGFANGTGSDARFVAPDGIAVGPDGVVRLADAANHVIWKGYVAPPDMPVVDLPVLRPGVTCHLDVTNLTTTSWSWSILRAPADSTALLSSTTARNPSFTPDVPDLYILRFKGENPQGRAVIRMFSIIADATPPTVNFATPKNGQRWSNAVFTVTGTAVDNTEVARIRCQVNDGDWIDAIGTTNWSAVVELSPGSNVVRACAVDVAGNISTTNSVGLTRFVAAPVTVTMNGLGTITPNYNGKLLEIGKSYTMTAGAAAGFVFTNWSGSLITNSPTLLFVMQSNLTFTANFRDIVKPILAIQFPLNGARVLTNSGSVTVRGTASDSRGIANVFYQLNGGDWTGADTANNWTNWFATVPMQIGTNILLACAQDQAGNRSLTNRVSFQYVVTSPVNLQLTGKGSVTGLTNNQQLELTRPYSFNVTAGLGFVFTNWTVQVDGATIASSNRPPIRFVMQSNLTLAVTFTDIQKPVLTITSPLSGARITNEQATVGGKVTDNGWVDSVQWRLNSNVWSSAAGTTNWQADLSLIPGTNRFEVYALDRDGQRSTTNRAAYFRVVPSPLNLSTNGAGRVTGATNGQPLEIGRSYTLTATPALRNYFAGWSGDRSSTNTVLSFLMQSNFTLQANFLTNPFVALKGNYYGLFAETNGVDDIRNHDRSGSFTLMLAEAGTYSASFRLGSQTLAATGKFDPLGQSLLQLKPTPTNPVTITLHLDVTNYNVDVEGALSNAFWLGELLGYRAPVYGTTNPAPQKGNYTLIIPGYDDTAKPGGDGYATVVVSATGQATTSGKLGDGTPLSQIIPVSADGRWALSALLYTGKGSVQGWMVFTNEPDSDIHGLLSWIKRAQVGAFYPQGFTNETPATGSRYISPGTTNRVLNFTNGEVSFTGGNLPQAFGNQIFLRTNNQVVNLSSNKLLLTFTLPTGLFTGSVTDTNTGKTTLFNGAVHQKLKAGYGLFLGTNQTGEVTIQPSP